MYLCSNRCRNRCLYVHLLHELDISCGNLMTINNR